MDEKRFTLGDILIDSLLAFIFAVSSSYLYTDVLENHYGLTALMWISFCTVAITVLFLYIRAVQYGVLAFLVTFSIILAVQLILPEYALITLPVPALEDIFYSRAVSAIICVACSVFAYIFVHYVQSFGFYTFIFVGSIGLLSAIGYRFSLILLLIIAQILLLILFRKNYLHFYNKGSGLIKPIHRLLASVLASSLLLSCVWGFCVKYPSLLDGPILGETAANDIKSLFTGKNSIELGYGSASRLGGNATLNNSPILYVKPENDNSFGVYLHGATYVDYTGLGWTGEDYEDESYSGQTDVIEEMIGVAEAYFTSYETVSLTVKHASNFSAVQLFTPVNTLSVSIEDTEVKSTSGLIPYAGKTVRTSYTVTAKTPSLSGMNTMKKNIFTRGFYGNVRSLISSELISYYKTVRSRYLRLPAAIPSEIIELAENITKNCDNDMDKALAVQSYLTSASNGFVYTLTPGDTPDDRDFVDYFLFETREGYCTYYASAMTVLMRACGVPARYAEGFYFSGDEEQDEEGYYIIRNSSAHAWCEVYIEGVGFVPFESTPGYTEVSKTASPTSSASTPTPTSAPTKAPTEKPTSAKTDEPSATSVQSAEPTSAPVQTAAPTSVPETPGSQDGSLRLIIIIAAAFLTALCVFIIYLRSKYFTIVRVRRSSPCIAASHAYKYALRKLKIVRNPDETLREYGARVNSSDKLSDSQKKAFERITDVYERSLYSGKSLDDTDKMTLVKGIKEI